METEKLDTLFITYTNTAGRQGFVLISEIVWAETLAPEDRMGKTGLKLRSGDVLFAQDSLDEILERLTYA